MERRVSGVGVLDKSVALLEAVATAGEPCTLTDLVARTGTPKATAHRLASALEAHGLLGRDDEGRYRLGLRLVGYGRAAADHWPLAAAARAALDALREATHESVQLYVREGDDRVCVASLDSGQELRTIVPEGSRLPLDRGSAGRILAADPLLPRAGWVESRGERAPGVGSVSAPVVVGGRVVAAVGISGPLERLGESPGPRYGPAVERAAAEIAAVAAALVP